MAPCGFLIENVIFRLAYILVAILMVGEKIIMKDCKVKNNSNIFHVLCVVYFFNCVIIIC